MPSQFVHRISQPGPVQHLLFWLGYVLFFGGFTVFAWHWPLAGAIRINLIWLLPNAALVYSFNYSVLPILQKKGIIHAFFLIIAWFGCCLGQYYLYRYILILPFGPIPDAYTHAHHLPNIFLAGGYYFGIITTMVATGIRLYRHFIRKEKENEELREQNHRAELQLLKNAMHPHFLFNTLNTLYSLTLRKSVEAPQMAQQLAALYQYVTEDCNVSVVPLQQEIDLITNYIALEKLRYGNRLRLQFETDGQVAGFGLSPFLLLPFVENAFKHGASQQEGAATIAIKLVVANKMVFFQVRNSQPVNNTKSGSYRGGVGLQNVTKRLDLLYSAHYQLVIMPEAEFYTIQLTLPLYEQKQEDVLHTPSIKWRSGGIFSAYYTWKNS